MLCSSTTSSEEHELIPPLLPTVLAPRWCAPTEQIKLVAFPRAVHIGGGGVLVMDFHPDTNPSALSAIPKV